MAIRNGSTNGESVPLLIILLGGVFALFAWVSPNHNLPWRSFHSELSLALCGFLMGGWILWHTRAQESVVPWLALASIALAGVAMLQFVLGLTPFFGDAWLVSLYAIGFALALAVGHRAGLCWGVPRVVEPYAWVMLLASLLSVYIQLYQWQDLEYLDWFIVTIVAGTRPFGNLTQPNHAATMLVLGLLAVAILFDRKRFAPWTALALVALFGLGIAMSQSRVGLLEVAVGTVLVVVRRSRLDGRMKASHGLYAAVLVAAMVAGWSQAKTATSLGAVGRPASELLSAQGARQIHWASMIDAIRRKPWIGYGAYGVSQAQYLVAPDHPTSLETLGHSHNLVLDLLVWDGIPIGLAATVVLGWWFWAAFRHVPDSQALLALGSVVVVLVHAMVEFPLYYTYFLLPTGMLMGLITVAAMPRGATTVPRALAPLAMAGVAIGTAFTTVDYFHLESDVQRSSFAHAHIGHGWNDRDYTRLRVLTHFNHFWNFVVEPERRGMTAAQLDEMRAVVLRFPSDANIVRYAAALALNGRPDEARAALARICKTGPVDACRSAETLWKALGRRDPEIGEVPWPVAAD